MVRTFVADCVCLYVIVFMCRVKSLNIQYFWTW